MSLALHIGAGRFRDSRIDFKYKALLKNALIEGIRLLKDSRSAEDVASLVVSILEESPLTNAGKGSNLTAKGFVETDSCIAVCNESEGLVVASMGAAYGIDSPALAVRQLLNEAREQGKTTASLTGKEAWEWARKTGLSSARSETELLTHNRTQASTDRWLEAFLNQQVPLPKASEDEPNFISMETDPRTVEDDNKHFSDTIGCLCIDTNGRIAACTSSGGPLFREEGRVGPAAIFGSGIFVSETLAVCASGNGEIICRETLATKGSDYDNLAHCPLPSSPVALLLLRKVENGNDKGAVEFRFSSPGFAIAHGDIHHPIVDSLNICILRK